MFSLKQYHLEIFILFFFLSIGKVILADEPVKKSVSINFPVVSNNFELNTRVSRILYVKLKAAGYKISEKAEIEILFTTSEINDSNQLLIAIIYMEALPKEIIDFNKKNEIFYKSIKDKENLPKEGKFIREMMTEEFLRNYRQPKGYDSLIVDKDDLDASIENMVRNLIIPSRTK